MELTAVLTPAPEGGFVALNPETGSTSQGETVEEAVANLRDATALYLEEFPLPSTTETVGCVVPLHPELKMGTLASVLRQAQVAPEEFLRAL
jgi:predicted RNase H-like HicB family nuclease